MTEEAGPARQLRGFLFWRSFPAMNERTRAGWRRRAALLAAALLHVGLLWLILPYMINRSEPPPSDPLDVAIVTPVPKPKPVRAPPAIRNAETNSSAAQSHLEPAPRLPRVPRPPRLELPAPLPQKAPMTLPAASAPPASGAQGAGSGANGTGAGYGTQEGNDYL